MSDFNVLFLCGVTFAGANLLAQGRRVDITARNHTCATAALSATTSA